MRERKSTANKELVRVRGLNTGQFRTPLRECHLAHEKPGPTNDEVPMRERASTANKKKRTIELLLSGETPGMAAQAVGTTRAQAYVWHNSDKTFAAKWDDAVATGMDLLESTCFKRALEGSDAMATLLLKCRRPEVFNPQVAVAPAFE